MRLRSVDISRRRVRGERPHHLVDHLRLDERHVALDVHDDVAGQIRGDFGDPIGAGAVRPVGHPHDAAEALDGLRNPRVIGGDDHGVDARGVGGAAVDVLDHRPAGDVGERFAGKAGRVVSGGDDGDGCEGL